MSGNKKLRRARRQLRQLTADYQALVDRKDKDKQPVLTLTNSTLLMGKAGTQPMISVKSDDGMYGVTMDSVFISDIDYRKPRAFLECHLRPIGMSLRRRALQTRLAWLVLLVWPERPVGGGAGIYFGGPSVGGTP